MKHKNQMYNYMVTITGGYTEQVRRFTDYTRAKSYFESIPINESTTVLFLEVLAQK